jgi:hypothetical protein
LTCAGRPTHSGLAHGIGARRPADRERPSGRRPVRRPGRHRSWTAASLRGRCCGRGEGHGTNAPTQMQSTASGDRVPGPRRLR